MPKRSSTRLTKTMIDKLAKPGFIWDSELPGFGLRLTATGTRSFIVQYRTLTGGQGRSVIGGYPALTVDEARSLARDQLREVEHGGNPSALKREVRKAPDLATLAAYYLETYAKQADLRPSTVKGAKTVLRLPIERMGTKKLSEFTAPMVRKLHGDALLEGQGRGRRGIYQANRLLAALSKMFNLAIELGWIDRNPCIGVKKFPEDQRWRNLSEVEVSSLLQSLLGISDASAADAIQLLLFTGARLQEVLKAEWSQFDLAKGIWTKPSSHTKTRRQHWLELDGPALALLRSMRERNRFNRFLFPGKVATGPDGKQLEKPRFDLKRPWDEAVLRAGLKDVRLHDLRRTTASFMLTGGASLATVGKALGHTQPSTTQRYAHLSQTVQREELRKAGERMVATLRLIPAK